jgi:general secretion pathway protein G
MHNNKSGFTLVELLVVISILGVLATIALTAFRSAQARGRDSERKSNLKQISSALELYYSDYGKYPDTLPWGQEFTDGKTIYFKIVPEDPSEGMSYYYRVVDSGTNQKFQLFAYLENTQDPDLITTSYGNCGKTCNFAITSPNTTPSE